MKKSYILIFFLICPNFAFSEILRPTPKLKPNEVISIQLTALKNNNIPYVNAGIEQTWEFAHPSNRFYTGPLSNFIKMMYSPTYSIILDHQDHKIILVNEVNNFSIFFVELIDKIGNKYGFRWIVTKVLNNGKFEDCWMTISVSQPISLTKSI